MQSISEATAMRLYNSVVGGTGASGSGGNIGVAVASPFRTISNTTTAVSTETSRKSLFSIHSANEVGNSCRICRWNRSDMQILKCPCQCRGSVGFVHLQCLRKWIMHKRDNRCEICNSPYDLPEEKINLGRMLRTFMCAKCFGAIIKHVLSSVSLVPLAHVILQQVLISMENLNHSPNEHLSVREVFVASCVLLTSSALFFHFFEFFTTRFMLIQNILSQWWMFGSASDFNLIEIDTESLDFFG